MPDNTSFVDKLRMNNIFPTDGGPHQGTPFGMPDLSGGGGQSNMLNQILPILISEKQKDRDHELALANIHNGGANGGNGAQGQIADQIRTHNTQPEQNVRYIPPESDKFATDIIHPPTKDLLAQGKLNIAQQREALAQKVASGKATDEEKQEYRMEQIYAQGGNQQDLEAMRGDDALKQIGARGKITDSQLTTKGNQRLGEIGARVAGQKEIQTMRGTQALDAIDERGDVTNATNAAKPVKGELPTQERVRQTNMGKELMNDRPDLAQFIKIDPINGTVTNTAPPDSDEFQIINNKLYSGAKDIPLVPSTGIPTNRQRRTGTTTPTSVTPTVNDPAGIR